MSPSKRSKSKSSNLWTDDLKEEKWVDLYKNDAQLGEESITEYDFLDQELDYSEYWEEHISIKKELKNKSKSKNKQKLLIEKKVEDYVIDVEAENYDFYDDKDG